MTISTTDDDGLDEKHSSIVIKAAKRGTELCVGQSLDFLISGG